MRRRRQEEERGNQATKITYNSRKGNAQQKIAPSSSTMAKNNGKTENNGRPKLIPEKKQKPHFGRKDARLVYKKLFIIEIS